MSTITDREDRLVFASTSRCRSRASELTELSFVQGPGDQDWTETVNQLNSIRSLEHDWDGEGTPAPDATLVDCAITLVQWLRQEGWTPPDRALASVNGAVVLEWYTPDSFIEIEVVSPSEAEGTILFHGHDTAQSLCLFRR